MESSADVLPTSLTQLIRQSLSNVDVDLRGVLLGNIVVTGGTSLIPGFVDRLYNEIAAIAPGVISHLFLILKS